MNDFYSKAKTYNVIYYGTVMSFSFKSPNNVGNLSYCKIWSRMITERMNASHFRLCCRQTVTAFPYCLPFKSTSFSSPSLSSVYISIEIFSLLSSRNSTTSESEAPTGLNWEALIQFDLIQSKEFVMASRSLWFPGKPSLSGSTHVQMFLRHSWIG